MTELQVLTPEIEGLLREIAADPDSCLLRLPQAEVREAAARGELPSAVDSTGLSSAERHLLRVYRRETAYLLRVACFRLLSIPGPNSNLLSRETQNGDFPPPAPDVWKRSARQVLGDVDDEALIDAMSLLAQCTSPQGSNRPSVLAMAAASMKLDPSDVVRNYASLEMILNRRPKSGLRMLTPNLGLGGLVGTIAAVNAALSYELQNRLDLSYDALLRIPDTEYWSLQKSMCGLALCAQLQRKTDARTWSSMLEEDPARPAVFDELLRQMAARRAMGIWTPRPGAAEVLREITTDRSERTRRVGDIFQ